MEANSVRVFQKYSEKSDAFSFGVLLWEVHVYEQPCFRIRFLAYMNAMQVFTRQEPYEGEKDLVALAFRIAVQGYRLSIPSAVPAPISRLMKYYSYHSSFPCAKSKPAYPVPSQGLLGD